jgi:hypothetical protein
MGGAGHMAREKWKKNLSSAECLGLDLGASEE